MLLGQRNKFPFHTWGANKEHSIVVETIQGILEFIESVGSDGIPACDVTEIKESRDTFDNLRRHVASNGCKVDLYDEISTVD
jgi:hypothetical protein